MKGISDKRIVLSYKRKIIFLPDFPHSNEVPIQPDILNQISQMFKLPPNFMNGRELNVHNLNLSGQRERPVIADEPSYLLVQTDQSLPQPLGMGWVYFSSILV